MPASTATALLDAAEAEFAASGIEDASLRAIMRSAGVDAGAIHYHFGTRTALAEAVLDRILAPLNERRLELLDRAVSALESPGAIGLEALLDALVRPDIETGRALHARARGSARLIGAIYIRPADFVEARVTRHFRPVARRFLPHLAAAVPHVDEETLSWRVRWCVFGTLGALLSDEAAPFADDPDALLDMLVTALAAALAAPVRAS